MNTKIWALRGMLKSTEPGISEVFVHSNSVAVPLNIKTYKSLWNLMEAMNPLSEKSADKHMHTHTCTDTYMQFS